MPQSRWRQTNPKSRRRTHTRTLGLPRFSSVFSVSFADETQKRIPEGRQKKKTARRAPLPSTADQPFELQSAKKTNALRGRQKYGRDRVARSASRQRKHARSVRRQPNKRNASQRAFTNVRRVMLASILTLTDPPRTVEKSRRKQNKQKEDEEKKKRSDRVSCAA